MTFHRSTDKQNEHNFISNGAFYVISTFQNYMYLDFKNSPVLFWERFLNFHKKNFGEEFEIVKHSLNEE